MFKKLLAIAVLACSLPVVANAAPTPWMLNTWAKTAGGTIDSRNNPIDPLTHLPVLQTSVHTNVFKSYTTHAAVPVVVTQAPGYTITKVTVNGVNTLNPANPFNTSVAGPTAQSVFATFQATALSVTAHANAGGSASPTSVANIYNGTKLVSALTFRFSPAAGYKVAGITGVGTYTVSPVGGDTGSAAVGQIVTVTIPVNTVITAPVVLDGSFSTSAYGANAGGPQTVTTNTPVTLTGTTVNTPAFQKWSSVSRPAGAAFIPTASINGATFTPAVEGAYVFMYRVAASGPQSTSQMTVTATGSLKQAALTQCINCHNSNNVGGAGKPTVVLSNWSTSSYYTAGVMCYSCHSGANSGGHPGVLADVVAGHNARNLSCEKCHSSAAATGNDAHGLAAANAPGCLDCHALDQVAGLTFFGDEKTKDIGGNITSNSGTRSITAEFNKRSHHITGAAPTNAQCAVCHLEGKYNGTKVVVSEYHMKDDKIYLRNADTGNTAYTWSGSEHTNMDNFCFSCHDSNGFNGLAASGLAPALPAAATNTNPFGDTLTNGYDLVARAGVVDVKTAFTTTNASHHAVSGQRYKYRFSTLANAEEWATRTGNPVPAASEIAEGHNDLDGNPIDWTGLTYEPTGPEEGGEATLYEGGKFVATYVPLGASLNVADNSTLHCGDCHTVGQWKAGSSTNADGSATSVVIGAHGSANEYLLRNSEGTDALHNGRTYVCFNCHSASTPTNQESNTQALWDELVAEGHINPSTAVTASYTNSNGLNPVVVPQNIPPTPVPSWKAGWNALHPTIIAGAIKGYATAHAVSAMHIQCEADSADNISGSGTLGSPLVIRGLQNFSSNRLQRSWAPQTVKAYDYAPAAGATAAAPLGGSNAASGNITGIACTNCHNSGLRSGFGGIHGGDNTYTDGLGRTQKSYRFMPGMGNYRYAPPGGWDGKDVSDPTLLTATNPLQNNGPANGSGSAGFPGTSGKPMGGCYTNGGTTSAGDLNNDGGVTYGVCNHHGTSTAKPASSGAGATPNVTTQTVTGNNVTFKATYGGGTTGSPTTYEPTVREATAGGTLVTRPLKY